MKDWGTFYNNFTKTKGDQLLIHMWHRSYCFLQWWIQWHVSIRDVSISEEMRRLCLGKFKNGIIYLWSFGHSWYSIKLMFSATFLNDIHVRITIWKLTWYQIFYFTASFILSHQKFVSFRGKQTARWYKTERN